MKRDISYYSDDLVIPEGVLTDYSVFTCLDNIPEMHRVARELGYRIIDCNKRPFPHYKITKFEAYRLLGKGATVVKFDGVSWEKQEQRISVYSELLVQAKKEHPGLDILNPPWDEIGGFDEARLEYLLALVKMRDHEKEVCFKCYGKGTEEVVKLSIVEEKVYKKVIPCRECFGATILPKEENLIWSANHYHIKDGIKLLTSGQ